MVVIAAMRAKLGSIAMIGPLGPQSKRAKSSKGLRTKPSETVFGANVAISELTQFILNTPRIKAKHIFYPPIAYLSDTETVRLPKSAHKHDFHRLHRDLSKLRIDAGLSLDASCDMLRQLRRHAVRGRYPIAVLHHTVSYQAMATGWFLPWLLQDVEPYDTILCTSSFARDSIEAMLAQLSERFRQNWGTRLKYPGRLDVVPLGVDCSRFKPREKTKVRKELGLPTDAFLIMWCGRISTNDKADLLPSVRVFAELVKRNPSKKLHLLIAGTLKEGSPDGLFLEDYARATGVSKCVEVFKDLRSEIRHLYFSAADVFLSPSDNIQETFGLAPIEAMASGVPQVVSKWDGYRDTVVHGETGFLIKTLWADCTRDIEALPAFFVANMLDHRVIAQSVVVDPGEMLEVLQRLMTNDELRKALGRASRVRALAHYDYPVVVEKYVDVLLELSTRAKRWHGRRRSDRHPFRPLEQFPFFDAFKGYASDLVGPDASVELTDWGRNVASGKESLPCYYEGLRTLDFDLLMEFLEWLARSRSASLRFEMALHRLGRMASGLERPRLIRHLLWGAKYGFLRVVPD